MEKSVNISGGSVQGFVQENHGTVNQYFITQMSELIGGSTSPEKSLTQAEYRQRKVLLSKVKEYWIQGVLEKSLQANAMIDLDLEQRSNAVERPFADFGEAFGSSEQPLSAGKDATEVFQQIGEGRTLLILGDPGSGKTITLLKLAQNLVNRTEEDLSQFIPVVLNLSSWGIKESTIDNWIVEELFIKYQVPKEIGKNWVEEQQLILLLDGLDEVSSNRREACVKAINQFTQTHSLTEMVVCSRIADYELLANRLKLRGAIYIRSLTPEQIDQYLENAGEPLEGVKTLLRQDTALQELAKVPLTLSIITLAYYGKKAQEIPQTGSLEIRRQHLFTTYVDQMFQRKRINQKYSREKTVQWLAWLAQKMSNLSQSMFLIEQIQPSWLPNKLENIFYRLGIVLAGTLVIAFILFIGMTFDLGNIQLNQLNVIALNIFAWGLVLFAYFGIGAIEINTFESLTWPWKKSGKELLAGFVKGLIWGFALCPFAILWCVRICRDGATQENIIASIILGLVLGLIIGIIDAVKGAEIETKTIPNQGIRQSAVNAGIITVISWIILSVMILNFFPMGLRSVSSIITWGLILGLLFGGGIAVIQHYGLRFFLWIRNYVPFSLVHLLDYASERVFLRKVGGGYIFIHRMLLEYFARMK
ncbi:MAG: NACHT domain-containing protein [Snowella sp.]|nr:NACHT domain-containing protein [Snowella sp.]